jgi:hypothetical protein
MNRSSAPGGTKASVTTLLFVPPQVMERVASSWAA